MRRFPFVDSATFFVTFSSSLNLNHLRVLKCEVEILDAEYLQLPSVQVLHMKANPDIEVSTLYSVFPNVTTKWLKILIN
jgi:hypothetical protein